jgi:hypothetical protein
MAFTLSARTLSAIVRLRPKKPRFPGLFCFLRPEASGINRLKPGQYVSKFVSIKRFC